ncbi:hypothetical protein [Microbacterium sp. E-13]|uniref:hypothetical protein n=1 Tax=Microbacterium sp. E-13 TaxID=3404048 RepID=UPI003CF86878
MAETVESRLDYLESELIAAGDIAKRLAAARSSIELIQGILVDLTKDLPDADEYDEDLAELERLVAAMHP